MKNPLDVNKWMRDIYGFEDGDIMHAGDIEEMLEQFQGDVVQARDSEILGWISEDIEDTKDLVGRSALHLLAAKIKASL